MTIVVGHNDLIVWTDRDGGQYIHVVGEAMHATTTSMLMHADFFHVDTHAATIIGGNE